jgi:prefoldin subunit 5
MLGVLLIFVELNHELSSAVAQKDVVVHAQVQVISKDIELLRKQTFELEQAQRDLVDVKEVYYILTKKYNDRGVTITVLERRIKQLKKGIENAR